MRGHRAKEPNKKTGKYGIVFKGNEGDYDKPITIPCGVCIGCRLENSKQWAIRMMHEYQEHDQTCFITLTYNEEHLPLNEVGTPTLWKRDHQLFIKRLRRHVDKVKPQHKNKIKFFLCGEYGDENARPHYHAIIFGWDFKDKEVRTYNHRKEPIFTSKTLTRLWSDNEGNEKGYSTIGAVSFDSAAYVARYVTKKIKGKGDPEKGIPSAKDFYCIEYEHVDRKTGEIYGGIYDRIEPEYAEMSRGNRFNPNNGIGRQWLEKYKDYTYEHDHVIMNGIKLKPPKYYDKLYEAMHEKEYSHVKARRRTEAEKHQDEALDPTRLHAKETILRKRTQTLTRKLEDFND